MLTKPVCRFVTQLAIAGMVFAQLVTATHACTVEGAVAPRAIAHVTSHGDTTEHPCAGMATEPAAAQSNLCEVHCTDGAMPPAPHDLPAVAFTALPAPVVSLAVLASTRAAMNTPYAALPGAPPLALRFCRLLI